jgi:acyl-coenzyme A thioesterase PaaI-like protein
MKLPPENTPLYFIDTGCFGCSIEKNTAGLHLSFKRIGNRIVTEYSIPDQFCGKPGNAHGGILATIFDEISCATVVFLRSREVSTGELTVRFQSMCRTESPAVFSSYIENEDHSRYAVVNGELHQGDKLLATSQCKIFYISDTPKQLWHLG